MPLLCVVRAIWAAGLRMWKSSWRTIPAKQLTISDHLPVQRLKKLTGLLSKLFLTCASMVPTWTMPFMRLWLSKTFFATTLSLNLKYCAQSRSLSLLKAKGKAKATSVALRLRGPTVALQARGLGRGNAGNGSRVIAPKQAVATSMPVPSVAALSMAPLLAQRVKSSDLLTCCRVPRHLVPRNTLM